MASEARTDKELLDILNDAGLWLVRGGPSGVLATAKNLQSAVVMAFEQTTANQAVQAIVKAPGDEIVILPDQLYRLWRHFRFEDQFGNQVGGVGGAIGSAGTPMDGDRQLTVGGAFAGTHPVVAPPNPESTGGGYSVLSPGVPPSPLSSLTVLDEQNQSADEVLLLYIYGGQTLRVSISRADLTNFQPGLSPGEQDDLIRRNLKTLEPIIEGKRIGDGVTQWTDTRTGRSLPLISLTRADLDQGLKVRPLIGDDGMPVSTILGGPLYTNIVPPWVGLPPLESTLLTNAIIPSGPPDLTTGFQPDPLALDPMTAETDIVSYDATLAGAELLAPVGNTPPEPPTPPPAPTPPADAPTPPPPGATMTGEGRLVAGATVLRPPPTPTTPLRQEIDNAIRVYLQKSLTGGTDQPPAAYRFTLRNDKIDILPEPPEPVDRELALDVYGELVRKARELLARLQGNNSAPRVSDSIERLLTTLGTSFDDLRPGMLLSCVRSIEADRLAFDTDEARAELFPDALAAMEDTLQTAGDLLATFQIIPRIEAARLALDLARHPGAVPVIERELAVVDAAAAKSGVVAETALAALTQNDAAIAGATDPAIRAELVGDKLLVHRNLRDVAEGVAAGLRASFTKAGVELSDVAGETWQRIKTLLPDGVGLLARYGPFLLFADQLHDPYLRMGAALPAVRPVWRGLKKAIKAIGDVAEKKQKAATSKKRAAATSAKSKLRKNADKSRRNQPRT